MKLLLDENLSRRLVPFLQNDFPESTQVALIGLEHADDRTIWEYAGNNDFVIVSRDADFEELSALWPAAAGALAQDAESVEVCHVKPAAGEPGCHLCSPA